jgi:hypothetical protein
MTSQTLHIQAVVGRLEHVERENHRLKRWGAVALIGIVAMVLMGQAVPGSRTVEAEQFVLKDASGKTRGTMATRADGTPRLEFLEEDGKPRVVLAVWPNGSASLGLSEKERMGGAMLATLPDGSTMLRLYDKNATPRAVLITAADGSSTLSFLDKDGKVLWKVP